MSKETMMVSDGMRIFREATSEEIAKAVPVKKVHRLSTVDIVELNDGVYLQSSGDGRYTLESDSNIPFAVVYKAGDPRTGQYNKETIGYLRVSALS